VTANRYLLHPHNMMNNAICRLWCTLRKLTTANLSWCGQHQSLISQTSLHFAVSLLPTVVTLQIRAIWFI